MLERWMWLLFSEQRLFRPRFHWLKWLPVLALIAVALLAIAPRVYTTFPIGTFK